MKIFFHWCKTFSPELGFLLLSWDLNPHSHPDWYIFCQAFFKILTRCHQFHFVDFLSVRDSTLPSDYLKAWNGHVPLRLSDLLKPYKYSVSCSLLPEYKAPVRVKLKSGISSLLISDCSNPSRAFSQHIILSCLFFYRSRLFPFNHYPSGRSVPDSIKLLSLVLLSLFVPLPPLLWTCWKLLHLSNPLFLMCYKLCTKLSFCLSSPPPSKFSLHFFSFCPGWCVFPETLDLDCHSSGGSFSRLPFSVFVLLLLCV